MERVVLAMSGGVDSSVAAHLLLESGYDVVGVFMRHGEASPVACADESGDRSIARAREPSQQTVQVPVLHDHKQGCCTASDAEDARRIADRLAIPFYSLNLEEEFAQIIDYFVEEYSTARTPNPCVMCNNWIKFGKLFDYADGIGARYVATGHYARLVTSEKGDATRLCRGVDSDKDQSYVLAGIDAVRLERMLLPVGEYKKPAIRQMAEELGMRVADKKDSQEICFVAPGQHDKFVRQRRGNIDSSGEIVTTDGEVVGRHAGIESFTIGQRKGLGVAFGEPRYVVRIEGETRRVFVGRKEELARSELTADQMNWLITPPQEPFCCAVQIRYNSSALAARVWPQPEGRLNVTFEEPCHGVAPGQAVVLYQEDQVLGGGWIC